MEWFTVELFILMLLRFAFCIIMVGANLIYILVALMPLQFRFTIPFYMLYERNIVAHFIVKRIFNQSVDKDIKRSFHLQDAKLYSL